MHVTQERWQVLLSCTASYIPGYYLITTLLMKILYSKKTLESCNLANTTRAASNDCSNSNCHQTGKSRSVLITTNSALKIYLNTIHIYTYNIQWNRLANKSEMWSIFLVVNELICVSWGLQKACFIIICLHNNTNRHHQNGPQAYFNTAAG